MNHIIRQYLNSFQAPYLQNRFLLENSRSLGSLPPNINYNGLLYSFVPELQMFVNQYGHAIDISQAAAFAEMSEMSSYSDIDDTSIDPGVTRRTTAERSAILAFAWSWPNQWVWSGNYWTRSDNSKNLAAFSQNLNLTSIDNDQSTVWVTQNIRSIQTGITAPDGSSTAFAFGTTGGTIYAAIRQIQYDLKPGTTYTFSYYRNITDGATGGTFRFRNVTGAVASNDIQPSITFTGSGWQRYSHTFSTEATQTGLDFYILSRSNSASETSGVTVYLWGAQLEEGSAATEYSRSYGFRDARGGSIGSTGPVYDYNETAWLNYGPTNGITYVWPMVNFYRISGWDIDNTNGWTQNSEINRITNQFKKLPEGKRSFQPTLFNRDDWFKLTSDKIGATGAASREYFGNTFPFTSSNISNNYPGPWNDYGIVAGSQFFNQLLDILGATGVVIDYVFGDNESNYPQNFGIVGVTGATVGYVSDPRYYQEWRGLTSWNSFMNSYGVTAANIKGPAVSQSNDKVAYLVWNNITKQYQAIVNNEIWANPTLQRYPNALVSNYGYWVSDGGPTYAAPDPFGHPQFNSKYVGNATSPVLYGEVTQIDATVSPGNVFVKPENPTFLVLAVSGATGVTLSKGPWTSFTQAMQEVRSAKRGAPNVPMTPWIASVRFAGICAYNDTRTAPTVGFADIGTGYSSIEGYTVGAPGNSAYYYELIKHVSLHGVKSICYWNSESFSIYENGSQLADREYFARGFTTYVQDISLFNNALKDVNDNLGGYTIETADSSRVSWLADYITSGAPKADGSYLWRTTIKPGTIFEYPDSALNPSKVLTGSCVGTWISTETNTPPVVQPQTLKDTFYIFGPSSTDGSPAEHGNGTPFAKWYALNKEVVTTFQGIPYTSTAGTVAVTMGRAYDFEMDPTNPEISSPWHNVMYENCVDAYLWGARSFYLSYPLGQIPQLAYPFRDVVNRRNGLYTSTSDPAYSPARWKGFTSSIKALLEGTLNPAGACAAKSGLGFTAMTEGCNVMIYFQGTNGYWENRYGNTGAGPDGLTFYPGSLKLWDDCFAIAGSSEGANNLYYSYVDQFVDEILSIKSNLGTAGTLTCAFDATVDSATPATLDLFSQLPSYYTRGNSYELGDWYIQERLRLGGVQCYTEARTETYKSLLNAGICGSGWDPALTTDTSIIRFNNKNLLMNSENFAYPGSWQRSLNPRVSGPTYGPSPIGTTNANLITFAQNYSRVIQVPTTGQRSALGVGNTCTYSMWIKRVSGNTGLILYHFNGGANETAITVTNDWARYSTSFAPTNTAVEVGIADKNSSGFGSVLVWGAQLETGSTATSYQSTTGKAEWKNWLAVEYNTWSQNPQNPVLGATQDGYYSGYLTDENTPTAFRWTQNTGPISSTKDPYRVPLTIGTGGVTYGLPFGFATWYYSPQKYLMDLYAASDVYRAFNNISNSGTTFAGVVYNMPTKGYILQYNDYARGSCGNVQIAVTNNYQSLTGYYRISTENAQEGNAIGYAAPFTKAFNQTAWISAGGSGASYAANGASGFWQLSAVTFWRENVKQPTFDGFLNMLRQVSLTGAPVYGNTAGWAGATYPYDFYSRGIMPLNYRN